MTFKGFLSRAALAGLFLITSTGYGHISAQAVRKIPRMPDGRPNLQGIWQVRNRASYDLQDHVARYTMPAGRGIVEGH